jgi:type I restriction enzyme M protein
MGKVLTKVNKFCGDQAPIARHFYEYEPPRSLGEIETEIRKLEEEIRGMLEEVL